MKLSSRSPIVIALFAVVSAAAVYQARSSAADPALASSPKSTLLAGSAYSMGTTFTLAATIRRVAVTAASGSEPKTAEEMLALMKAGGVPATVIPEKILIDWNSLVAQLAGSTALPPGDNDPLESDALAFRITADGEGKFQIESKDQGGRVAYLSDGGPSDNVARDYCVDIPGKGNKTPTLGDLGCSMPESNDQLVFSIAGDAPSQHATILCRVQDDGSLLITVGSSAAE